MKTWDVLDFGYWFLRFWTPFWEINLSSKLCVKNRPKKIKKVPKSTRKTSLCFPLPFAFFFTTLLRPIRFQRIRPLLGLPNERNFLINLNLLKILRFKKSYRFLIKNQLFSEIYLYRDFISVAKIARKDFLSVKRARKNALFQRSEKEVVQIPPRSHENRTRRRKFPQEICMSRADLSCERPG